MKTAILSPKLILASLLENRASGLALAGVTGIHLGIVALGLPSFVCPIRAATGVPCPGCGLSRGVSALTHGNVRDMLALHAFTPMLILAMAFIATVDILPSQSRAAIVAWVTVFERRTSLVLVGLLMLLCYWLARLLWFGFPAELYR